MPTPDDLPRALAIVGPTASSKSELGARAAERFGLPVLVCDSVKVYRGLDIGSAKPSPQLRARAQHLLVDMIDPDQRFSAGDYAERAWEQLAHASGLFVGGTGFYLRAVTSTLSGADARLGETESQRVERSTFEAELRAREREDPGSVWRALVAVDPQTAKDVHPRNLVRALRALWLCRRHGGPVSRVRHGDPPRQRLRVLALVLDPGASLGARIDARIDAMLAAGWLSEVEKLSERGYDARHKAMQSLGYRQLLDVVEGRSDLASARQSILAATRRYARRQRTWFRTQLGEYDVIRLREPDDCPWTRVEAFLGASCRTGSER